MFDKSTIAPISKDLRKKSLPLSFGQQRLWFIDQLEPGNSIYNISSAYRLSGSLDLDALHKSLEHIILRHEDLRTTFPSVDGVAKQVVSESINFTLKTVDLNASDIKMQAETIEEIIEEEVALPFDLGRGPLFRATLIQQSPTEQLLILMMHHIVSDGWSMGILFDELTNCYQAYGQGESPSLEPLPIQYADFSIWQREWMSGNTLEKQLTFWKNKLGGAPPVLELPTDYPRPAIQNYTGTDESFMLPKPLVDGLKSISVNQRATLFMTLMSAFNVLLYRYTGQTDILVGAPIANRNRKEIIGLIGFFVNTLVLRTQLTGGLTFTQLLDQVKENALDAYEHQDLPFEKLVEELQPARSLRYSPLFQVMFALQNTPEGRLHFSGVDVEPVRINPPGAMFDLSVSLTEKDGQLLGTVNYRTDLFHTGTIKRMVGHFTTLLEGIVAEPETPVAKLPILPNAERQKMLVNWNGKKAAFPPNMCVHQLIEEQVEKAPDAVALVFQEVHLTYRELNQRSNQLAHYLQSLGVGPAVPVGICMERSIEMIVGILGILKAGGAYVPLDPGYPEKRLAYMLDDTRSPVLVTQKNLIHCLPVEYSGETVFFDELPEGVFDEPKDNPDVASFPEQLIYVMYTSGSTGNPKGVMISHGNVVGFLHGYRKMTSPDEGKRIGTTVMTFSFDTSVEEIFATLCFGGELHILESDYGMRPDAFAGYLVAHQITHTYINPDLIPAIADYLKNSAEPCHLKCLITGLMPKKQKVLQLIRDLSDNIRILNAYGPTEVTYGATAYDFKTAAEPDRNTPIGVSFPNYDVYIVDQNLQPVPIGVEGELLIGGVGLSKGYLNQPQLTKNQFIPHPFSDNPHAKVYKTGDRVKYLPDGNIDFLGRFDHQVKIRGYRVEPGEIETVLSQHADVRETIIIAKEFTDQISINDKRLVAYLVCSSRNQPDIGDLRTHLKQTLPDYMIPSFFIFLDEIPYAPNGKVDRAALPEPDMSRPLSETTFVEPDTPIEKKLAEIWSDLLKIEKIGINDNFFLIGGHSLLAIQMVSRLKSFLQVEIPLKVLFEAPTIKELSLHIIQMKAKQTETDFLNMLESVEELTEEEALSKLDNIGKA